MASDPRSRHNQERDRLLKSWNSEPAFQCAGCGEDKVLPSGMRIATEVRFDGLLRADLGAFDANSGEIMGTLEVIDTNEPSDLVLASQERLSFAYFRFLPRDYSPARRPLDYEMDYEMEISRGNDPKRARPDCSAGVWLCSVECLRWWQMWGAYSRVSQWEAPKCDKCGIYLHENPISAGAFRSWAYDPYTTYCIHCAAKFVASAPDVQWRTPGELCGGDPREWTPGESADPQSLLMAYSEAAFWNMVWKQRVANLRKPYSYDGSNHLEAEEAAAVRLSEVERAFDEGDWVKGANLLLPIGAPGWAAYEDEPQRLLAFRNDNCKGVAHSWARLLHYRLEQLPEELREIIRAHEPQQQEKIEEPECARDQGTQDLLREQEASERRMARKQSEQQRYEELKQEFAELSNLFKRPRNPA